MPLRRLSPLMSPRLATATAVVSTAAIAAVDFLTPANLIGSMLYVVPLAFAGITRDRRLLGGVFVAAQVLNVLAYVVGPAAVPGAETAVIVNRGLAAVILLASAAALLSWINDESVVETQRAALAEQNRELEAINEELGQREEEIVRQN